MPELSFFTLAKYRELKNAQRAINESLPQLDKAEKCGIECQEFRAYARDALDKLSLIETHFFTPPPTS